MQLEYIPIGNLDINKQYLRNVSKNNKIAIMSETRFSSNAGPQEVTAKMTEHLCGNLLELQGKAFGLQIHHHC